MEASTNNDENHSRRHEPESRIDGREQLNQGDNHEVENVDQGNNASEGSVQLSHDDLFPWKFTPKWPITRAERIGELEQMAPFYENTPQKENTAAAIDWHAQFNADDLVPTDLVMFQKGKQIEEAGMRPEDGAPWEEGCVIDLMTGHAPIQPAPMSSGVHSSITQKADWTYYNRSSSSHMYQLSIEVRVLVSDGGNGQILKLPVHYGSGASNMALPLTDLASMVAPTPISSFPTIHTVTASGPYIARRVPVEVRVLSRDGTKFLGTWREAQCTGYLNISARMLRKALEDQFFICNQPHLQRLYVAETGSQLCQCMSKKP